MKFIETNDPDILQTMGRKKGKKYLAGFAVETENEKKNALAKLEKKNLDLIILNNPLHSGAGFATETNKVVLFDKNEESKQLPILSKQEVAKEIFNKIAKEIS